jgi:hypothetical protein
MKTRCVSVALSLFCVAGGWNTSNAQGTVTEEKQAWGQVDSLSRESVDGFLKQFPSGQLAQQARFALELQDRFAAIRSGKSKPQVTIPLTVLGDRWQNWQQRKPGKGVAGYSANPSGTLGVFFDPALSGGKTGGVGSISFDSGGVPASYTGDGSIVAFSTNGVQFEYLRGVIISNPSGEKIYFGVLADKGLVHLKGEGSVTLPDGKKINLK